MLKKITSFFMSIVFFFASLFGMGVKTDNSVIYKNLKYGKEKRQVIDLCIPKDAKGEVNLFLNIHGGAWVYGDKESYFEGLENMSASFGICTAAMNYRFVNEKSHNEEIMDDITSCLQKIKDTAAKRDVTVKKVILSGFSAGGHLSLQYAYSKADSAPIKPVAVVSYSGPTDMTDDAFYHNNSLGSEEDLCSVFSALCAKKFTYSEKENAIEALKSVSPLFFVNENTVPTVLCHGKKDTIVPFSNATSLNEKLTQFGIKHELVVYPNSNHGLESDPESAAKANSLLCEYIETYLIGS